MDRRYDPHAIEEKWQRLWKEREAYRTTDESEKPKYYCLDFFPYPSGDGLSVGHCRNYVPTDTYSRFKRMQGFNVLHPMGWDAFGLPAENYAIKMGVHPRITTERNIANYHRQMDLIGLSFDWSREITSCLPDYYRWTQWFFLLLYERGLAYRSTGQQWWCPSCKTILANEQVEQGRCWRCGSEVTKKDLEQWFLRITDYAQRLLDDLGHHRLARADQAHADQLDRPQRGRRGRLRAAGPGRGRRAHGVHDAAGHALRRHLHGAGAGAPPGRRAHRAREARGGRGLSGPGAARERDRAPQHGEGQDRRLHRRVCRQPRERRAGPDLDQRLRAHGLRHRRDHGRAGARRARLPVRDPVRDPDRRGDRAAERGAGDARRGLHRRRRHGELGAVRRPGGARRGVRGRGGLARRARRRAQEDQLQAQGLAHQSPAVLGHADPDRALREVRPGAGAGPGPAGGAPRPRGLPPDRRRPLAAGPRPGVRQHDVPRVRRSRQARDRHHGHLRLLELVPLPLRLAARRDGGLRPRQGRALGAGGPLRRRRRARRHAPALRALLLQGGAGRRLPELRRALRAACATRA